MQINFHRIVQFDRQSVREVNNYHLRSNCVLMIWSCSLWHFLQSQKEIFVLSLFWISRLIPNAHFFFCQRDAVIVDPHIIEASIIRGASKESSRLFDDQSRILLSCKSLLSPSVPVPPVSLPCISVLWARALCCHSSVLQQQIIALPSSAFTFTIIILFFSSKKQQ